MRANVPITNEELLLLVGRHRNTIGKLHRLGIIRPLVGGRPGKGNSARWTLLHALAVRVFYALTQLGIDPAGAARVLRLLAEKPAGHFEANLESGASHLLLIGSTVSPRLVEIDALNHPAGVDTTELRRLGLEWSTLDIRPIWETVQADAVRLKRQAAAAPGGPDHLLLGPAGRGEP